jgi:CheY-like chemotaxis protein
LCGRAAMGNTVPRILVADDNANIQKMVVLAFQERGVEVVTVGNGEAAVRKLPEANPDLVLADVFMPVRNGYEVCEFIKKDTRFAHIPVILLVGAFDPLDEKEARRVGADGVLKKPFVPPDPLIAMVMSALEKNPRIVAEMAKAKELAAAPPPQSAALENPAKAAPKPLPDFPEPSPEEAAMIYGFGKGVRGIEAEGEEGEEENTKSLKAAKGSKELKESRPAKGPVAPKGPVVSTVEDPDEEEGFDGAATANDWRRSAADFEVPENVASDPVYSYGQNFEPITFPSERDVPPKKVRAEDARAEDAEAAAPAEVSAKEDAPAASASLSSPEHVAENQDAKSAAWEITDQAEVELATGTFTPVEEHVSEAKSSENKTAEAPVAEQVETAAPESAAQQEEVHEAPARSGIVARVRGWMDMMSSSPAEPADDHWMENLSAPAGKEQRAAHQEPEPVLQNADEPAPQEHAADAYIAEAEPAVAELTVMEPAVMEIRAEAVHSEEPSAVSSASEETKSEEESRPLEEAKFSDAGRAGSSYHFSSDAGSEDHGKAEDHQEASNAAASEEAPQADAVAEAAAHEKPFESEPEPVTSSGFDFAPDLLMEPANGSRNGGASSGLMPAEPLIPSEQNRDAGDYSSRDEEPGETDNRQQEAFAEESQPGQQFLPPPDENYWDREAEAHEQAEMEHGGASLFDDSSDEMTNREFVERIPTLPPPNREALSEIPFLMPPLLGPQNANESLSEKANSDTVDEVVRQVMAKLGPHLQELLSQGVKPLVENLLQNELHKKEK